MDPAPLPVAVENLSVALVDKLPTQPLVLIDGGFLAQLKQVGQHVESLKITDGQSAQHAADLLVRVTEARKKLDETRLSLWRPLQDQIDKLNAAAKAPLSRLDALKEKLKAAQLAWAQAEAARVAREARERQAELDRLAAEVAAETAAEQARLDKIAADQAEADRIAAEQAEQARAAATAAGIRVVDDEDDEPEPVPVAPVPPPEPTEAEKALERARFAPAPVAAKPVGVQTRTVLVPEVVDIMQVPETFITRTAKMDAIRATFCAKWVKDSPLPTLAGVKFTPTESVVSTGRRVI